MNDVGIRRPSEFCWTNMITPSPDEARAFFGRLLGWTYFDIPGLGHGARVEGHDVGALFDLHASHTPPGLKPHIGPLIKVADVDATCDKVRSLGGSARPPFAVGDQGRMTVGHAPDGSEFDAWEPGTFHGTDVDPASHGAPSWFELMTDDVARSTDFYAALFGWSPEVKPMPDFDYTVFHLDGKPVAGLMPIPAGKADVIRPHWGCYYSVDDVDRTAREAIELGGSLYVPVQDIPGIGRFCGITSPQGVKFYAITYLPRTQA